MNTKKNSFRVLLLSMFLFLLAGCSEYIRVYQTKADGIDNGKFTYETNAVKITYYFWAKNGVMEFTIYNKLNQPIFIDWKKSSFIHSSNKLNYWTDEELKSNITYYYTGPLIPYNIGVGSETGKTIKPERITFIPPQSSYYKSQFYLLPISPKANFQEVSNQARPIKKLGIYEVSYSKEESPLSFRNYIAFSLTENFSETVYIDNEFYLSNIKEMKYDDFNRGYPKKDDRGKHLKNEKGAYLYVQPLIKANSFYKIVPYNKRIK